MLDRAGLSELSDRACSTPRLRLNRNLHGMPDPVHRLLNAIEPGSYVRPHRHLDPPKSETVIVLAGALGLILFDAEGNEIERERLEASGERFGADIFPGTWHSFVALSKGTVFFETKPGPYVSPAAADLAGWAPAEGESGARELEERWRRIFTLSP